MDPSDPNYYPYHQVPPQGQYAAVGTSSMSNMPAYGQPLPSQPQEQAYYQTQQANYPGPYDHPMPNYPPGGYDTLGVPQQYAEQPFEVATEVIIEGSEREKQAKKRKEQNRLAQRKFRTQNKIKIKDLQKQLGSLENEVKGLKQDNVHLKDEREYLQSKINDLKRENNALKTSSTESSPAVSPSDTYWQFGGSEEFPSPSTPLRGGSMSSYSPGSHYSR